jgi:hypothetical protein
MRFAYAVYAATTAEIHGYQEVLTGLASLASLREQTACTCGHLQGRTESEHFPECPLDTGQEGDRA